MPNSIGRWPSRGPPTSDLHEPAGVARRGFMTPFRLRGLEPVDIPVLSPCPKLPERLRSLPGAASLDTPPTIEADGSAAHGCPNRPVSPRVEETGQHRNRQVTIEDAGGCHIQALT